MSKAAASSSAVGDHHHLRLSAVCGVDGKVNEALHAHPDGRTLIFPLGSTVVLRDVKNPNTGAFLQGHTDRVSAIAVSRTGRYIASGQVTHMGFQADIIVWDYATKQPIHRLTLHKVKVQALSFSSDERFLASVGGQDDNTLVIWDLETGKPLCGGPASTEPTHTVAFFRNRNDCLVTGGNYVLRVWEVDMVNRKIRPTDVNMGQLKRVVNTIAVDADDNYAYCGTTSGDVLCIQLQGPKIFKFAGPKVKFSQGALCTSFSPSGHLVVGGGDGTIALLNREDLSLAKSAKLLGSVTSVSLSPAGDNFFVGTSQSNIYAVRAETMDAELRTTCHSDRINDVAFPDGFSEVFATCSANDIRIWNTRSLAELLRIQVPNLECNCITFSRDGKSVISGWSDGRVRAFGPQTGKLLYTINDAHRVVGQKRVSGHLSGVTSIAASHDLTRLATGGSDGQVRVWRVTPSTQTMEASMKEHKGTVNSVQFRKNDLELISASDDGSCIVWDLRRFVRNNIIYAQTYFRSALYFNDESQIVTTGSDKKVCYWDSYDCSAIREVEGSKTGEINALDISPDGSMLATGGSDKLVRIWDYDAGVVSAVGVGHSGSVCKTKFSPDQRLIISVGEEGAIFLWSL